MSKRKPNANTEQETGNGQFDVGVEIPPKRGGHRSSQVRQFLEAMPVGASTVVPKSQAGNWRAHCQRLGYKITTRTESQLTNLAEDKFRLRIWRTE